MLIEHWTERWSNVVWWTDQHRVELLVHPIFFLRMRLSNWLLYGGLVGAATVLLDLGVSETYLSGFAAGAAFVVVCVGGVFVVRHCLYGTEVNH